LTLAADPGRIASRRFQFSTPELFACTLKIVVYRLLPIKNFV
jgi:hypothetical protein